MEGSFNPGRCRPGFIRKMYHDQHQQVDQQLADLAGINKKSERQARFFGFMLTFVEVPLDILKSGASFFESIGAVFENLRRMGRDQIWDLAGKERLYTEAAEDCGHSAQRAVKDLGQSILKTVAFPALMARHIMHVMRDEDPKQYLNALRRNHLFYKGRCSAELQGDDLDNHLDQEWAQEAVRLDQKEFTGGYTTSEEPPTQFSIAEGLKDWWHTTFRLDEFIRLKNEIELSNQMGELAAELGAQAPSPVSASETATQAPSGTPSSTPEKETTPPQAATAPEDQVTTSAQPSEAQAPPPEPAKGMGIFTPPEMAIIDPFIRTPTQHIQSSSYGDTGSALKPALYMVKKKVGDKFLLEILKQQIPTTEFKLYTLEFDNPAPSSPEIETALEQAKAEDCSQYKVNSWLQNNFSEEADETETLRGWPQEELISEEISTSQELPEEAPTKAPKPPPRPSKQQREAESRNTLRFTLEEQLQAYFEHLPEVRQIQKINLTSPLTTVEREEIGRHLQAGHKHAIITPQEFGPAMNERIRTFFAVERTGTSMSIHILRVKVNADMQEEEALLTLRMSQGTRHPNIITSTLREAKESFQKIDFENNESHISWHRTFEKLWPEEERDQIPIL